MGFVSGAGVVMALETASALAHFSAEAFLPSILALRVTREWGAWGAAVVVCVHVTAAQHDRQSRPADPKSRPSRSRLGRAADAAILVPILYLPTCILALASAFLVLRLALRLPVSAFMGLLTPDDAGCGAVAALTLGLVPFVWTFASDKLFARSARGLGFKLAMTWVSMLSLSWLTTAVRSCVR